MITIKKFVFNPVQENTYLLFDETKECVIVDAGCYSESEQDKLMLFIEDNNLKPVRLINTHCHFDHIMGVTFLRQRYQVPFFAHQADSFLVERAVAQGESFGMPIESVENPDQWIEERVNIEFGNSYLETIHVPGHSPGSIVFHQPAQKFILAGDVLFRGSIGRTDLQGGSYETLISNITNKLLSLSDDTIVYSGHGPETSIEFERSNNPFLIG